MPQSASPESPNDPGQDLSCEDRNVLIQIARETILARFQKRDPAYPPIPPALRRRAGAFVTLHEQQGTAFCLRGCIGYLGEAFQLADAVKRAALGSAFHDHRFPPLTAPEFERVRVEISVLGTFRRVENCEQIVPGLHGLLIRKGGTSGLLLPQVATEFGWNREELLEHLCRKAGLSDRAYLDRDAEIESFTAVVFGESGIEPRPARAI